MRNNPEALYLVFDWGNTLMRTFPEYSGAMCAWPHVEGVPGIADALAQLSLTHTIIVGSNAQDSNSDQVRAALNRIGIGQYITHIFTFHELRTKKPDRAFFANIKDVLGATNEQLVMIGDDWITDCLGAHQARWRTIWYNPQHLLCPGLIPIHDLEIDHMNQLSQIKDSTYLPSWEDCVGWLLRAESPHNLLSHLQTVAAVGYCLAIWLSQAGYEINPVLVHRAGLLHDISKVEARRATETAIGHGELGSRRLQALGQPVLAEITRRHPLEAILDINTRPQSLEEIVVFYADKLVDGHHLVTPEERINILARRYPDFADNIEKTRPAVLEMQMNLCQKMNIPAIELIPRLKKALGNK